LEPCRVKESLQRSKEISAHNVHLLQIRMIIECGNTRIQKKKAIAIVPRRPKHDPFQIIESTTFLEIFETLGQHSTKEVVSKVGAIYRFDIKTGDSTRSWIADLKNGTGKVTEVTGKDTKGECTIIMAEKDFVALMTGKLDGQQAFMGGQLKIKGDMMLAMKLEELSAAVPKDALPKL